MSFASGIYAIGICDRCGFQYKLLELREEISNRVKSNMLVCTTCWDKEAPEDELSLTKVYDPQALRKARPDTGRMSSESMVGWNPLRGIGIKISLGGVTVGPS